MPLITYEHTNFGADRLAMIRQANVIIDEYRADGFDLTLRQLYYQFVQRDWLANTVANYNRLGACISAARRAGLVDWEMIVDRTRELRSLSHWDTPAEIVDAISKQYRRDMWESQPIYVEVWFEKDALLGVFERSAHAVDVPYFSCRGYSSDSELWAAGQRFRAALDNGKERVVVLHFGDHDPSGIDMTRDIRERSWLFAAKTDDDDETYVNSGDDGGKTLDDLIESIQIVRVALNMDQVRKYNPPPNPAKTTDARFAGYEAKYGVSSWELDALNPRVLDQLVRSNVAALIKDKSAWDKTAAEQKEGRALLASASTRWADVVKFLRKPARKAKS
jgi:hypothetical protein